MNVGEAFVTIQIIWVALEGLQVLSQMSIKNAQEYYISFINKIKREKEIWIISNPYLPSVVENLTFMQLSRDGGQTTHTTQNCHPWSGSDSFSNHGDSLFSATNKTQLLV